MAELNQSVEQDLKSIAELSLTLNTGDVRLLERIAGTLSEITFHDENDLVPLFSGVSDKILEYVRNMMSGVEQEIDPLKEGVLLLRALDRAIRNKSEFIFEIGDVMNMLDKPDDDSETESAENEESKIISTATRHLETLTGLSKVIKANDIPSMGKLLNELDEIENETVDDDFSEIQKVNHACHRYLEKLILGEEDDFEPVNDALQMMRAMLRSIIKNEPFVFEIDDIIETLGGGSVQDGHVESGQTEEAVKEPVRIISRPVTDLEEEDMAILSDFILESRDNLETIEVNLIDLEQSPDDAEIMNAIFRPFHTIKGVSGFLDLRKINALSHSTENLLDSARKGECVVGNEVADVILQAVDLLKKLIDTVETGVQNGKTPDDHDIEIDSLVNRIELLNSTMGMPPQDTKTVGEILIDKGAVDENDLTEALEKQKQSPDKKIGEILLEDKKVDSKEVISALREQKRAKRVSIPQVKVDTNKLDNLVDLTGELVIAQSMLRQNAWEGGGNSENQKLSQNLNQLGQIVSNIQKIAMSMRMVPISATFQKMVRLVRDLAKSCKKDVALEMFGEETEIDRNVVEALYEPMVHMIRNSIDHGLESTGDRVAAGKSEKGKVTLRAYHKGGNIVIEISDDGKGLNKMMILEKAMNSGLVEPDAVLTDSEIFQLVMEPGFSTAQAITDISGRGVGMDVVKKAIENLNGRVEIQSTEGKGSTFTISLPLTLAIIEGMLVRIGQERFIVPTMAIIESLKPEKEAYFTVEGKGEMLMFRNTLIPLVRLSRICNVVMDQEDVWNTIVIVVENKQEQRGILIDELLGKEEFVIKSLGEALKGIKGLAGGAILGDGRVGLILDIAGLFDVAENY